MRLFFAIPVPPAVRASVAALAQAAGGRATRESQVHLTLRFVGEVEETRSESLIAQVRAVEWRSPFVARLRGLGTFGARVLWLGVDPAEPVCALAAALESAVTDAGLPPETRAYTPHVTLARYERPQRRPIAQFVAAHTTFTTEPFAVDRVVLYRSTLRPTGAVHDELASFPLG